MCLLPVMAAMSCGGGDDSFDATGTFEAAEVVVSAEENGRLVQFTPEEGDVLEVGQEAGLIDTVQLYLTRKQLKADIAALESQSPDVLTQIAATKRQIEAAEREKLRVENLLASNAANRKDLDACNDQLDILRSQLKAQTSTLDKNVASLAAQAESLQARVEQVEDHLRKCRVTAPVGGVVLAKYAEQGEFASAGKPLFKIADTGRMYLRAYVTSDQLSAVKAGQEAVVFADFGGENLKEFKGRVTWISDRAEFTPKTILTKDERANQVYAVKIAIENDGTAKIGMYGRVKF